MEEGKGSGPLPGQDVTVVQTPDKTKFVYDPMAKELREGAKYDEGKCRLDLIPEDALWVLGEVYTLGARKYADWNWARGLKYSRVVAALRRHLAKFIMGESLDQKDRQHHLASVAWCALSLLHYDLNKERFKEFDDRRIGMWAKVWEDKE